MRIVLAAYGTRGDVQPLATLGAALVARGHEIVLASSPDQQRVAERAGLAFAAVGSDVTHWLERLDVATLSVVDTVRELRAYFEADLPAQLNALVDLSAGADVIIAAGLQPFARSVAELTGCASAYAYYSPTLQRTRLYPPIGVPYQRLPGWVNASLFRVLEWVLDRGLIPIVNRARATHGLPPHPGILAGLADHILWAWDPALAPPPLDFVDTVRSLQLTATHHAVGALLPPPGSLSDAVHTFLDEGPCIYVGFGSMPQRDAQGLQQLVQQAAEQGDVRAIALDAQPRREGRVLFVDNIDHGALFPHLKLVVHHGGAGTTASAARAGVPQVVVPHFVDQHFWAHRVTLRGVAVDVIRRPRLTAAHLVAACGRADAALPAALALQQALAATDPVATAVAAIERLGRAR